MKDLKRDERRKITFTIQRTIGNGSSLMEFLATDILYSKTAKESLKRLNLIFKLKNTFAKMYPDSIVRLSIKIDTVKFEK